MASTYVNDLRLNELATGDGAGTWGTTTNTNLELIGEAFSYGTEAITTNADTHATTIADGATDPGRSMYLKYTGTLDSACTITIGPNTVSKMWFIENATTGSQNIIISQGSGANITIPAGDTKAVYSDGAGSGAAFVDAFASLSVVDLKVQDDLTVTDDMTVGGTLGVTGVLTATSLDISGDIDVDGTTNLDVVDIDGAVDMASTLGVTGVVTANAGVKVDNITIDGQEIDVSSGDLTLDVAGDIILDADGGNVKLLDGGVVNLDIYKFGGNVYIENPTSDSDIIFSGNDGGSAITALTLDMSAAGAATFNSTINGVGISSNISNFAQGILISQDANTGTLSTASDNTGLGYEVFNALTSGDNNTIMGAYAGDALTTGSHNTGIGRASLSALTTADNNTGVGSQALRVVSTGANNTAVGSQALTTNTTGEANVAMGGNALDANTTGHSNVSMGYGSLGANTTGATNVGVGKETLFTNTTSANNTAIGNQALYFNTAANNTAVGSAALVANTTGVVNTAVGALCFRC